jgi:hypothetical protein
VPGSSGRALSRSTKQRANLLISVVKNFLDIAPDGEPVNRASQQAEWKRILHRIADPRPIFNRVKAMDVPPKLVWPLDLQVFKIVGWFPSRDFCFPTERNAMPAKFVIDDDTGRHLNRFGSENLKAQPSRRQGFQVPRVGKKCEHFLQPTWNPLLALECKRGAHRFLPRTWERRLQFHYHFVAILPQRISHSLHVGAVRCRSRGEVELELVPGANYFAPFDGALC